MTYTHRPASGLTTHPASAPGSPLRHWPLLPAPSATGSPSFGPPFLQSPLCIPSFWPRSRAMAYSRYGFFFCHMASLSQSFLCCLDLSDTIRAKIKRPYPCCTFFAQVFITRLYIWFKVNACTNFRYWHIAKQCCFSMAKCTSFLFRDYSCYFMAHRCSFIKSPANVSAYSTHTYSHLGHTIDSCTGTTAADSGRIRHHQSWFPPPDIRVAEYLWFSSTLSWFFPKCQFSGITCPDFSNRSAALPRTIIMSRYSPFVRTQPFVNSWIYIRKSLHSFIPITSSLRVNSSSKSRTI